MHCLSDLTLANREFAHLPQTVDFIAGFTRAAPCPSDQLKLFSASAVERSGVAFSLVSFFWRSKRKILAIGETHAKTLQQTNLLTAVEKEAFCKAKKQPLLL
jgi:uroporphyrinogen-III synthase